MLHLIFVICHTLRFFQHVEDKVYKYSHCFPVNITNFKERENMNSKEQWHCQVEGVDQ
ncbi:hypothetical protein Bca101_023622 [Brassica carinata]